MDKATQRATYGGVAPSSRRGQKLYKWGVMSGTVLGTIFLGAWAISASWFVGQSTWFQVALVAIPYLWGAVWALGLLAALWLNSRADQLLLDQVGIYPFSASAGNESLQTMVFRRPAALIEGGALADAELLQSMGAANGGSVTVDAPRVNDQSKVITWHAIRCGVWLGGAVHSPWGPVVIAPVRNGKYDASLQKVYETKGRIPRVPPTEWAGKLRAYFESGRYYVIPGAARIGYLGSKYPDGLGHFRPWIKRSFSPKLSRWARIIVITDPSPEMEDLERSAQPPALTTSAEWIAADWERRARYHESTGEDVMMSTRRRREILGSREDELDFEET